MKNKTLCLVDIADQEFWKFPDEFVCAIRERLPNNVFIKIVKEKTEFLKAIRSADYIIGFPFSANLVRKNERLLWVHFLTAHLPSSWNKLASNTVVTRSDGVNANSVVDHGMYLVYRSLRGEPRKRNLSEWDPAAYNVAQNPRNMTVGVMGYGAIGSQIATRLKSVFSEVAIFTRSSPVNSNENNTENITYYRDKIQFIQKCDFVIITLPLNKETQNIFDGPFYAGLKSKITIVNLARAELLDEALLIKYLESNLESVYYTDVLIPEPYPADGPLAQSEQVFYTPHIAGRYEGVWDDLVSDTISKMKKYME